MTSKAVIPATMPLHAFQMSSPAYSFDRVVPRAAAVVLECEVGPGAINSPGRCRNRRKGESESPPSPGSPQSLQKLGDARLKAERRAKGRATGGWDAGIKERVVLGFPIRRNSLLGRFDM